ncbi:DUF2891 domain-containing protein [Sandarakinorhabdus sp.]|uniref:DUF2891 domain-containing protein n=1 Tax=Sandarakinorhabdus sp. TaxID=1916663 RepID=UPI0033402D8E
MMLDNDLAGRMAGIALGHVGREYPHKLDHVMANAADVRSPRDLHPIFFGSFDWHSCVHGWWLLMRLLHLFPDHARADETRALAASLFTPANVAAERAYLARPESRGFERPYGWAWLLYLHAQMASANNVLAPILEPLAQDISQNFRHMLGQFTYPIRTGAHGNTGFALVLGARWAADHDPALLALMAATARRWYGDDRRAQAWEPDGDAFLSPTLMAALAMAALLPAPEFRRWFRAYLPDLARQAPASLFTPASVSDRSDGKIAHLDGLNLSRAWAFRRLAAALNPRSAAVPALAAAADAHLAAAMPHIAGDYAGEHWLASFALLALLA